MMVQTHRRKISRKRKDDEMGVMSDSQTGPPRWWEKGSSRTHRLNKTATAKNSLPMKRQGADCWSVVKPSCVSRVSLK